MVLKYNINITYLQLLYIKLHVQSTSTDTPSADMHSFLSRFATTYKL